jgi:hypothetical protein
VIFFGIAAWNVGATQYPQTSWQNTQKESFYVNLGSVQQVQTAYFWVPSGSGNATIYSGSPGNWTNLGNLNLEPAGTNYQVFVSLTINANTQYLSFDVTPTNYDARPMFATSSIQNPSDQEPSPFIQISEIGLQSQSNQQIPIPVGGITGENTTDSTLNKMIDEQSSLQIPPTYMQKMYFDEVYFARSAELIPRWAN